jgi:N-methylhydantoinase B
MAASVEAARQATPDWQPGDIVVLNDPYRGGSHLPDITSVSPVFRGDTLVAFLATRAHHADIGGAAPGSMALSRDLASEGLVIPPVRLRRHGDVALDVMDLICANSRTPAERRGDLDAQIASHEMGERRLRELIGDDPGHFAGLTRTLLDYSERRCRAALSAVASGRFSFEDALDGDGLGGGPIPIRVVLTLDDGGLTADFTGTATQVPTGMNAPIAVTRSAVYYVVACLIGDVPINAGAFRPVTVHAPLGSLLNPRPGAAVAGGNVETSQRVVDVVLGALAGARPDLIPAASQGTMNNLTLGGVDPGSGAPFSYYETLGGGAGAGRDAPGASALQVHMTNTRNTPVEALEADLPVRVTATRVRSGSGGAGLAAGGDGIERIIEVLAPTRVSLLTERRALAPWGLDGGRPGARGENGLLRDGQEIPLPAKGTFDLQSGEAIVIRTPGGGGWGRPSGPAEVPLRTASRQDVYDRQDEDGPGHDVQEQQLVGEQDLLRRAPKALDLDEVQVPKDGVQDERDGEE